MKKTATRFFSMLLVLALVLSMVPMAVFATENEEEAVVETVVETTAETAEETTETAAEEENEEVSFNFASLAPALLNAEDVEVDEDDPAIIAFETELKEIKVLMADGSVGNLTDEQVESILGTYQQYLDHWEANANVLGVQTPFFLQYNDNKDGLGILGEMLILGGNTVDDIRNGVLTYDDINGMITTFLFADQMGVQLYGSKVTSARDEILDLVEASGAKTDVQKYMIINNWLAQNVVFDMEYIMNTDKEEDEKPMKAENPQEHEYYDVVYDAIYDAYEPEIEKMFYNEIYAGIVDSLRQTFYKEAIKQMMYDGYIDAAKADDTVVEYAKQMYYNDVYEAELAKEEQKAYDEAYAAYATHEHKLTATFTWNADNTASATAYCENGYESYNAAVVEVTSTTTATCTAAGETTYTATATFADDNANKVGEAYEKKTVATAALGHDYNANGICTRCEAVAEGHEHSWNEGTVTTAATCETEGVKTYTCTSCNETMTEAIEAIGHNLSEPKVSYEPTCTQAGFATATCQNDGCDYEEETPVEALGHDYVDGVCSRCSNVNGDHTHNWVDVEITKEATCGEDGSKTVTCTLCDSIDTVVIPATGEHVDNYGDDVCDVCGQDIPSETAGTTETLNADGDVDPDADNYAKAVVAEKKADIEAAAAATAQSASDAATAEDLADYTEAIVCGTEDETTETESDAAAYADKFLEDNAEAIDADALGFITNMLVQQLGEEAGKQYAAQIEAQCDAFVKDAEENGVDMNDDGRPDATVAQMTEQQLASTDPAVDLDEDGTPDVTFEQAIQIYTDAAASQLTQAVLNYWQGSHFGALGRGSAVCLGYTKAFTYLVQCLKSDIYTTNGNIDNASNWKKAEDLYYTNGELDINKNYAVDCVRITFDADVTMYGETQENFNSDHFWNAVKVDGKWYYVDPCYVDVYTEVMIRDRVETDGSNNYMYFMFSHNTTTELYDGYYSEIKTLYANAATYTDYEDSWISRIKSNIYTSNGYVYYVYDSTDLVTLLEDYNNNSSSMQEVDLNNSEIKLVRHQLTTADAGSNGDTDYDTLIEFNYAADEDSDETVARVKDSSGNMVENEMLTALFAQHQDDKEIYPSLAITCALSGNKLYFNLSDCLLAYDLNTCEVTLVKEYNTVYGVRDDTVAFGGMAFSTTTSASGADFTIEEHPIAGISLKDDGYLYVSIATNFAFISGKDAHNSADQGSYGYEFEESNFNSEYNSYTNDQYDSSMYEQMGYEQEINDNDEFMWSANFVEKLQMSHLTGSSHRYSAVSVDASCRHNAYTENRCSTCGVIEADTRVEEANTALEHHYLRFDEVYYTKDSNDNWNTGFCYVCTECLFAIEEPTEPDPDQDYESYGTTYEEQLAIYEEEKAIYDNAVETAGHTYVPTDASWSADCNTVTFSKVACSANCTERPLDCLIDDDTVTMSFRPSVSLSGSTLIGYSGDCSTGAYATYEIVGTTNGVTVTAQTSVQLDPGDHVYTTEMTWNAVTDEDGNYVTDEEGYIQFTVDIEATCAICGYESAAEGVKAVVDTEKCVAPTIEAAGKNVYTATVTFTNESGKNVGTVSGVKELVSVAAPEVTISNDEATGKIKLNWTEVDGAVKYLIYRSTSEDDTYTMLREATSTKYQNSSTVAGTTYYYYVVAVSADGVESKMTEDDIVARMCDLAQPKVTTTNVESTGKIKITWTAIDNAVNYRVYRSTSKNSGYSLLKTTTDTSIINSTVEAGETYYYKVRAMAKESGANSAYSAPSGRTCDLPRTSVTLSNVASNGKIQISWTAVDGATKYQIVRSLTGEDGSWTHLKYTTDTSVVNSKTEAGVTYYYKVRAIAEESSANSAYSTVKYHVCDLAQPSVSVALTAAGNPKLSWKAVDGAVSYKVYRSTSGKDGTWSRISTTTNTSLSDKNNIVSGQKYYYKVIAIAEISAANSAYSKVISVKAK